MNSILLGNQIDQLLPQTQCRKCGFQDCYSYAQAIANEKVDYKLCEPGGNIVTYKIANLLGKHLKNESYNKHNKAVIAIIDESSCIGCTLCIQVCPISAIVGTAKHMHSIIKKWCTGCALCIPACPVDCIKLVSTPLQSDHIIEKERSDVLRERYREFKKRRIIKSHLKRKNFLSKEKTAENCQDNSLDKKKKSLLLSQAIARAKLLRSADTSIITSNKIMLKEKLIE